MLSSSIRLASQHDTPDATHALFLVRQACFLTSAPRSKLQYRPRIIIHRRINHPMTQQLIPRFHHIRNLHPQRRRYILHMQPLIMLRARLQRPIHPPRPRAHIRHLPSIHRARVRRVLLIPHLRLLAVRAVGAVDGRFAELLGRAAREV